MGLYLVDSFMAVNFLTKLACGFELLAMFTGWIAFCTDNWGRRFTDATDTDYYFGYGVWSIADNAYKNAGGSTGSNAPVATVLPTDGWLLTWYGFFQVYATLAFVAVNSGFFQLILLIFVGPCKGRRSLGFWNGINNIYGCVCWLLAVIVFAVNFDDKFDVTGVSKTHELHYSFGFAIVTMVLQLVTGILLVVAGRSGATVHSSK